jgi:hypothetical protein
MEDELGDMLLDAHSQISSQPFLEHGEYHNAPTQLGK